MKTSFPSSILSAQLMRPIALLLVALGPVAALRAQNFYATPYVFTTLAGSAGNSGSTDGTGTAARFSSPYGVAVDGAGNFYVADNGNHTIRKVSPAGVVTTLAGSAGNSGSSDGTGSTARFNFPFGVAVDGPGNVYVADYFNYTVRKITPAGVVTTLAGSAGNSGSTDGTGSAARFNVITDLAADGAGNLYVADYGNHTIRKVTPAGVVTTLAGTAGSSGATDGVGSTARFKNPNGVAVDGAGNVFVADYLNQTIRKITPAGMVTTLAGTVGGAGSIDGTGSTARFNYPSGVTVDAAGNVFVVDYLGQTIRKISSAGVVTTIAGSPGTAGSSDGSGSSAQFNFPVRAVVDATGNLYVSDNVNQTIRKGAPPATGSSITASDGASVTFTAAASGTPVPTYQWQKGGVDIAGATGRSYTIASTVIGDAGNYTVFANNSVGNATSVTALAVNRLCSDFNLDGKADILWTNSSTGDRAMWLMNGTTIDVNAFVGTVPVEWVVSGTGDFNGDRKADILWTNTATGDRAMWLMNGSTISTGGYLGAIAVAWVVSGTGDFDGDQKTDILWTNTATGERAMWLMNGTTASSGASLGTLPLSWTVSGTGDFNGDGKTDILWSNTVTGDRAMWLMNGTVVNTNTFLGTIPVNWSVSGTGDFDGDGEADILWVNTSTGDRATWLMNGSTIDTGGYLGAVAVEWVVSGARDFNGDGKADILWSNTVTGERAMWLMNGSVASSGASLGTIPVAWLPNN